MADKAADELKPEQLRRIQRNPSGPVVGMCGLMQGVRRPEDGHASGSRRAERPDDRAGMHRVPP